VPAKAQAREITRTRSELPPPQHRHSERDGLLLRGMLFEYLADRIKALAKRRGWLIIPVLLIVLSVAWDVLVFTHTMSWVIEHFPTIRWLGAIAMNHLVPLAMLLIGLAWLAFRFLRPAKPTITYPRNRDLKDTPMMVGGTHGNQTGNYWLATNEGNNYWPKSKVSFQPDGRWDEQINTGRGKKVTISLVKVSDLLHVAFENWMRNANKTQNWNAFSLPQTTTKEDLTKVDSIVVTVATTPKL
jgi:hypothetical protein